MHVRILDNPLVLFTIRSKCHTTVVEHFQIWPHFIDGLFTRNLQHAVEHREHPRWHTTQVGDILVHSHPSNAVTLFLEIRQQSDFFRRNSTEVHGLRYILNENSTEVAHDGIWRIEIRRVATTQNQTLSLENARARVLLQIAGNGIASTLIVNLLETIHTDRNELALVVGRSRRLSKKAHLSWPKHIRCSFTHAMDITFQFLVGVEVLIGRKILITTYVGKTIFLAPLRINSFGDQLLQHVHLNFFSVRGILLQRFHAWSKIYFIDEFGSNVHILAI